MLRKGSSGVQKFVLNVQGRPNPESDAEHSWLC